MTVNELKTGIIPEHVAIIMDGNGRWAKSRGLSRSDGHREGVETIREVAIAANLLEIKVLTLYAFSTENWKRPVQEIAFLMKLPQEFFARFVPELIENNIRVEMSGFKEKIPLPTQRAIKKAIAETAHCTGMVLNFAFNYGGRAEIVQAVRDISEEVLSGDLLPAKIDEEIVREHLLTSSLSPYDDVDYLIRTSGEQRLSNFLLWQNAYSEFYFTETYWPDFDRDRFYEAIASYQARDRRFGRVSENKAEESK